MSAFQDALADFLRLQQAEEELAPIAEAEERDEDLMAAWAATQAAFDRMFTMPAANLSQSAAKLAAVSSYYMMPSCGCDPEAWAMLVAEVCRFGATDALRAAAV